MARQKPISDEPSRYEIRFSETRFAETDQILVFPEIGATIGIGGSLALPLTPSIFLVTGDSVLLRFYVLRSRPVFESSNRSTLDIVEVRSGQRSESAAERCRYCSAGPPSPNLQCAVTRSAAWRSSHREAQDAKHEQPEEDSHKRHRASDAIDARSHISGAAISPTPRRARYSRTRKPPTSLSNSGAAR